MKNANLKQVGEFHETAAKSKIRPPKNRGQTRRWHCGAYTSINFRKKLRRLEPQGDHFAGLMLADVSATRTSVLT